MQGKKRFTAKLTGPARIGYLSEIFPDAEFVHVVRDSRAVVESLMRVPFWRQRDRHHTPAWEGGLRQEDLDCWHELGDSPVALAAVQWRAVVERAREEAADTAPDRYVEVRYEDFVADPHRLLDEMYGFCGLSPERTPHEFVDERLGVRDMRAGWRERLSAEDVAAIDAATGETMRALGYAAEGAIDPAARLLRPVAA